MMHMPHGFQRICSIMLEVGLVNLKVGVGRARKESPECAKRTVTTIMDNSADML